MTIAGGSTHYKGGGVEPLELIEAQGIGFHLGNVIKYAVRAHFYASAPRATTRDNEERVRDAIQKATWYLDRFWVQYQQHTLKPTADVLATTPVSPRS